MHDLRNEGMLCQDRRSYDTRHDTAQLLFVDSLGSEKHFELQQMYRQSVAKAVGNIELSNEGSCLVQ